ncbi:transcription initiation factor IIA subunit 1 [Galendromus occidentalis]|uniref:Transcription initiation factor IIA subunit 1 n=1 Tax=Galendromus occidentalis TaxID=34638 RepID=A0AAJ6VZ38_9ACAR|nr:transcription initiation factor IIA subunit 1 [Galendromus occidentalis]
MSSVTVGRIYKSVIDDVITGVKDAFLDENADEQVLMELKQLWEKKLADSKAIEPQEPPAPLVKVNSNKADSNVPPGITIQRSGSTPNEQYNYPQVRVIQQSQPMVHYPGTAASSIGGHSGNTPVALRVPAPTNQPGAITLPPEITAQILQSNNGTITPVQMQALQNMMMSRQQFAKSTGQAQYTITVPVPAGQQTVQGAMPHVAGAQLVSGPQMQPVTTAQQIQQHLQQPQQAGTAAGLRVVKMPGQTDGATMDSSDSDDSSDEDRIGANDDDDGDDLDEDEDDQQDNELDEEPLNSNDDVSDEELSEAQEIDNVVVCQYDKISRSRNRWKFHLKDGIMNIQGRDYVFQKSTGDAEW